MSVRAFLRIVALAAVLVPFGTGAADASSITTITCGFGTAESGCDGTPTEQIFDFGPYFVVLDFAAFGGGVIGGFEITMGAVPTDQSQVAGRFPSPDFSCVPIAGLGPGQNCVEFVILSAPPQQGVNFTGDYRIDIVWFAPTDDDFPDAPGGRIRLLHNSSLVPGNGFADITIPGSYFGGNCIIGTCPEDPGIGGRDNDFQSFIVAHSATEVPEPATLMLVGSGLAGAIAARRRRRVRQDPRA